VYRDVTLAACPVFIYSPHPAACRTRARASCPTSAAMLACTGTCEQQWTCATGTAASSGTWQQTLPSTSMT
jgi:hypothetical protein